MTPNPSTTVSLAAVDRLRAAIAAVAHERNSGDGHVSSAGVDELLDAAQAVLPAPSCEICGSSSGPVRPTGDVDPRVSQVVCIDVEACMRRCDDESGDLQTAHRPAPQERRIGGWRTS